MSSGRRDLLFFGSIAANIVGHEIKNADLAAQLERQNAFIKLRTTVSPQSTKTEEIFGLVATSPLYEIRPDASHGATPASRDGHPQRQRAAFLPLMMELSHDAVAEEVPTVENEEEELLHGDPSGADSRAAGYLAAVVRVEVDMSRSGCPTSAVGVKRVVIPSLNVHAHHDTCSVVVIHLYGDIIQRAAVRVLTPEDVEKQCSALDEAAAEGEQDGDIVMSIFVVLRVLNLASKVCVSIEADDAMRAFLDVADPVPKLHTTLLQRMELPYGSMPLIELFKHYRHFHSCYCNKVLQHTDEVVQLLSDGGAMREAESSFPHRWNLFSSIDLRRVLLGEDTCAALLLTLSHCSNIRSLHVDGNQLSDLTCARMYALLRRHRYLGSISFSKNAAHEAGAAQLLRLVRENRRISALQCSGNYFSESMRRRLNAVVTRNRSAIECDPLNIFSSQYSYLKTLEDLPSSIQQQGIQVWAMLSAAPVGDVDVMVRNLTTSTRPTLGDDPSLAIQRAKVANQARETISLIPPSAAAPLLNEVMRTISVSVSLVIPDPLIRSLFTDIETALATPGEGKSVTCTTAFADSGSDALPQELRQALGAAPPRKMDAEAIYASSFLRIVVTAMRGVAMGFEWSEVASALQSIGKTQAEFGVMPEDYWLVIHVLMASVHLSCGGADGFDPEHASSFLALLALAVRTAIGTDVVIA